MIKLLILFIVLLFSLTGCSKIKTQEVTINAPYEISIDNVILSYYDTKDSIPSDFNILDNSLDNYQNKDNNILVDSNGIVRCISITDKDIDTYKEISVGDDTNKIEDSFSYEYKNGDNYMVIFNGNTEEDPTNQNKEDSWIWINYTSDGSQITQIQIYDVKYGREMR